MTGRLWRLLAAGAAFLITAAIYLYATRVPAVDPARVASIATISPGLNLQTFYDPEKAPGIALIEAYNRSRRGWQPVSDGCPHVRMLVITLEGGRVIELESGGAGRVKEGEKVVHRFTTSQGPVHDLIRKDFPKGRAPRC